MQETGFNTKTTVITNKQLKKKVLFVIDTLQIGGAEQSLLANASYFKSIEPVICHIYKGDLLKSKFIEKGLKVHSLNIQSKYGFFEAYGKLKKLVEMEKPDLMVGYITRSEIVTRLVGKNKNIPVIGTFITDLYSDAYNKHLTWKAKKMVSFFKIINQYTSKNCIGFVANSEAIKQSNAKFLKIPLNKIKVINRGRESRKIAVKETEAANNAEIKFVNVSRLYHQKGQIELIKGFKNIADKNSSVTLTIIGDGPMKNELEQLLKNLQLTDKVFLLGSRNDVLTQLAQYSCFVFPSMEEGFSGSIVEAMFACLPVLASNIGPNREAIKHLETGYLFEKESPEEVEKAMQWYLDNTCLANKIATQGYNFAKSNFELEKISMQFEDYLSHYINA